MTREKVVVFIDYANINRASSDNNYELDYAALLNYFGEGRFIVDAHCYVPVDPRNEHRMDKEINSLWDCGYLVNAKVGKIAGDTYKCDFDIEITMDLLQTAYQVKPDIIVLASGDVDFIPVILELRRMGVRVEVASFERSISNEVIRKASGFISLDTYCNECAASDLSDTSNEIPASGVYGNEHGIDRDALNLNDTEPMLHDNDLQND